MPSWASGLLGLTIVLAYVYVGLRHARWAYTRLEPRAVDNAARVGYGLLAALALLAWPLSWLAASFTRYISGDLRRARLAHDERVATVRQQLAGWREIGANPDLPADARRQAGELTRELERELARLLAER
jgi:hypothetical protein